MFSLPVLTLCTFYSLNPAASLFPISSALLFSLCLMIHCGRGHQSAAHLSPLPIVSVLKISLVQGGSDGNLGAEAPWDRDTPRQALHRPERMWSNYPSVLGALPGFCTVNRPSQQDRLDWNLPELQTPLPPQFRAAAPAASAQRLHSSDTDPVSSKIFRSSSLETFPLMILHAIPQPKLRTSLKYHLEWW